MPSQLSKVQKHINKKKGPSKINALHQNSRDAQRLRRASARDDRITRTTQTRHKANTPWLERISFFQSHLTETLHPLSIPDIQSLVEEFLARHDSELDALKSERRIGRPPSNRQNLLEQQIKAERLEYESGFWVPDSRDAESLMNLDGWNGEWLGLGTMRFVRVGRNGDVKESQFPPRGAS